MSHEGMVHALEEIHRLLRRDGSLIDIHPVPEAPVIEVVHRGRILFAEVVPVRGCEDERQAEAALAQVLRRGLFFAEGSAEFDFLTYGSTVAELVDFMEKANAYSERPRDEAVEAREAELSARVEEIRRAAGEGAEVAYRERARIARLRPVRG